MATAKHSILVVDDEPDLREVLSFTFERKGYAVFTAGNAVEAMDVVKKNNIDIIISDMRMPGGDGMQLLSEVKKYNPQSPLMIFVTGFAEITFEEAYDKGIEAIFEKPFNTKALVAGVEKLLLTREERWKSNRAPREPSSFQIDLKLGSFAAAQSGHVLNIGRGGFFVGMAENFPKLETIVSFRIVSDEQPPTIVEGDGKVKWVRTKPNGDLPPGCGVEFLSLDDTNRSKIFELINFSNTQQYIPKS